MVSLKAWRKNKRYSRLTVTRDGYRFAYDTKDACWRRLDIPREIPQTPEQKKQAKAAHHAAVQKKRESKQRRAERLKWLEKDGLEWLTINWFKSGGLFGVLVGLIGLNALFLPSFPIVAFAVGGALTCSGFSIIYALLGGPEGSRDRYDLVRWGLAVIFGIPALFPFFAFWGLHTFFVFLARLL